MKWKKVVFDRGGGGLLSVHVLGIDLVAIDVQEGVDRHLAENGPEILHLQHDVLLTVRASPVTDGDGIDCNADFE